LRLQVNGEQHELAEGLSLQELVQSLKLKPEQIAIELNQVVVRRPEWGSTKLKQNDRIEIVHFVGGGTGQSAVGSRQEQSAGTGGSSRRQE
jgi:thiamine biosynthesis protein ThiS